MTFAQKGFHTIGEGIDRRKIERITPHDVEFAYPRGHLERVKFMGKLASGKTHDLYSFSITS
ncbi:MAG TPA: hypothetical protein VF910_07495 [Candidatus Bathyarchaeia archaeon]